MKKIISLSLLSLLLLSCGGNENSQDIDTLIKNKDAKALQTKKTALQSDIAKIEAALSTLDVKTEEALVAVTTVKDTLFHTI